MFGYVLPSRDRLDERERERFRAVYCGLCHTLRERYGFAASLLLNYDFTLLAILLSSGDEESCAVRRCAVHPCKGCRAQTSTPALEAAADRTVILSWWQLRDHIADHGFWSGLKYRFASLFLRGAYRRAGERLPRFDAAVRLHLQALAALEDARCASIDMAAEPFAALMADAAADLTDEKRRRILGQILYQLGRWIYLIDAADDLKKDTESGNYNPLLYRYHTENGVLGDAAVRLHLQALAALEDARCASIDMAAEPFAALMADAAADLTDEKRRRILGQILYQLGRWIYLIDAADDLKKDTESGNYNPLLYRYHTENGVLGDADRLALAETLDASIERMASAYALYDYGVWTPILDSIFYESLYGIGKAVLDGTYRRRTRTRYGERKKKSNEEAL